MAKSLKVLKKHYDEVIEITHYTYLIVAKNGKYGMIDRYSGELVIPMDYDHIQEAKRGFLVQKNGYCGILDSDNSILIPIEYEQIIDELWFGLLKKDEKYAIYQFNYDENSQLNFKKTALKYDTATAFDIQSEATIVSCAGKYGIVNRELQEIVPLNYDAISHFQWLPNNQYVVIANLNSQYGMINLEHQVIIPFEYDELSFTTIDDILLTKKNGLYALLNYAKNKIKLITPFKYHEILDFYDDLAGFCVQSKSFKIFTTQKWGFIDPNGVEIITPQFDNIIYPFIKGRAYVELNGERFFIDKNGERILENTPIEYTHQIQTLKDNVAQLAHYFLEENNESYYQAKQHDLTILYWSMPYDFNINDTPEHDQYQQEFKLYNELRQKMRLEHMDNLDDLLRNDQHYPVISVNFKIKIKTSLYQGNADICFVILLENDRVYLTKTQTLFASYIDMIKESQPFDLDHLTDEDIQHFNLLNQYIEQACCDLEIYTEQNQGIFTPKEAHDEQESIARFVELLYKNEILHKKDMNKLKKGLIELRENPHKIRKKLEKALDYEKDDLIDADHEYLAQLFLCDVIYHYHDDWKYDSEALSHFIGEYIEQDFVISESDRKQGLNHINQILESQFEYVLLNIDSGSDELILIMVTCSDKAEILSLAKMLDIPMSENL